MLAEINLASLLFNNQALFFFPLKYIYFLIYAPDITEQGKSLQPTISSLQNESILGHT